MTFPAARFVSPYVLPLTGKVTLLTVPVVS